MAELLSRLQGALEDRYRIEREIGAGGMATVYLAHDLRHDRRVALKLMRPELSAVIGAERFLAEIKLTANLQHPHILPLFDSGEADGCLFYVMPFVEGESLRERLTREKQLPVPEAVRIAAEVASALDYAHRHGVVHRDIKPENILLHDGRALVADFGIALAASKASGNRMTETGMSLGTPHYMSPEQAMGEREITARSDVYALGAMLYEMLTGDPPFTGSTAQAVVARVLTEAPRPILPQRHTIPPHVEAAVLTALEKLPADRFATAAEFGEALSGRGYVPTVPSPAATPPSPSSPSPLHCGAGSGRGRPEQSTASASSSLRSRRCCRSPSRATGSRSLPTATESYTWDRLSEEDDCGCASTTSSPLDRSPAPRGRDRPSSRPTAARLAT
jgi:eukaryotic-like serine/threonine-protein kinase